MEQDRTASTYYREVGLQPIPTAEEERSLFSQYRVALERRNKKEAVRLRQKIACGYLKFVIRHASRKTKNPELMADLIAEGNIGLMVAIDKFDTDRGTRFLTYGASWIDVYMREFINRLPGVHMPNHKRKELRRQRSDEDKRMALGELREYTVQEPTTTSFDAMALSDPAVNIEQAVHNNRTNVLKYLVDAGLSSRERFIVIHYYGLRGGEQKNFRDLACFMYLLDGAGSSSEQIRQLKQKAMIRLSRYLKGIGIERLDEVL